MKNESGGLLERLKAWMWLLLCFWIFGVSTIMFPLMVNQGFSIDTSRTFLWMGIFIALACFARGLGAWIMTVVKESRDEGTSMNPLKWFKMGKGDQP